MEWFFTDLVILLPFLLGIGLLVVEVFIPGFGIAGLSGLVMEVIAITFAYLHHGTMAALIVAGITAAVFALTLFLSFRSATRGRLSRSALILNDAETAVTASDEAPVKVGEQGSTITALRPSGIAEFNGIRTNVMTEGAFIEAGQTVRVLKTNGSKVTVELIK